MYRYMKHFTCMRNVPFKYNKCSLLPYSCTSGNILPTKSTKSGKLSDEIKFVTNIFPMEFAADEETSATKISTFAVVDLETSGLSHKISITELSIHAFSAEKLTESFDNLNDDKNVSLPEPPRVLHKLTLLFNPRLGIHPIAEKITGLNNDMLEHESHFDENAASTIKSFIQHLQKPVCLVAHNGFNFDFPLLKQSLDKVKQSLPDDTLCLDSFWAFHEIDKMRSLNNVKEIEEKVTQLEADKIQDESNAVIETETSECIVINDDAKILTDVDAEFSTTSVMSAANVLLDNENINWRAINETTPKRSTIANKQVKVKNVESIIGGIATISDGVKIKSRRSLFKEFVHAKNDGTVRKKWPPKGKYKLPNIFTRIFNQPPKQSHYAEADVDVLTKLMQYYGEDFLEYAIRYAKPFSEIQRYGHKCKWI